MTQEAYASRIDNGTSVFLKRLNECMAAEADRLARTDMRGKARAGRVMIA